MRHAFLRTAVVIWAGSGLSACADSSESNHAPELLPIEEAEFKVNQGGSIDLYAADADGDKLTWSFTIDPEPPTQTSGLSGKPAITALSKEHARFTWTPGVADAKAAASAPYSVVVKVTDEHGAEDSGRFVLTVVNDGGVSNGNVLRFIEPQGAGMAVDLSQTNCIKDLPVTVKGDQIPADEVQVWMADPILEGATLKGWGKERKFSWCPPAELLDNSLNHAVIFEASQADSELNVEKRFWFRFKRPAAALCPGTAPVISHQAPSGFTGALNYEIKAKITDDIGFKAPPYLIFSSTEPQNGDTSGWPLVDFKSLGQNEWSAEIPNLNLADGETARIYYQIIATDNDDHTGTTCDHTTESEILSFSVKGGQAEGETYGFCHSCVSDAQCGGAKDACVPLSGGAFCTLACVNGQCDAGSVCTSYESVDGVVSEQCLPLGLTCSSGCVIDDFDAAARNNSEELGTRIPAGQYEHLSICSGDQDFFKVHVEQGQKIVARIEFNNADGDLEMAMAMPGDAHYLYQSQSENDFEQVQEKCIAQSGDADIVVYPYETNENEYRLIVEIGEGECGAVCENDMYDIYGGNDSLDYSIEIDLPFFKENLMICPDDVDYFSFNATAGEIIDMMIEFVHGEGDLNLALYNASGTLLERSDTSRDLEMIEYQMPETGRYLVEIAGVSSSMANSYNLWVDRYQVSSCENDSDCPAGSYCATGTCRDDACAALTGDCFNEHVCVSNVAGSDLSVVGGICALRCESQSDCRPGYACKRFEDYTWACAPSGTAGIGERCETFKDCAGVRVCLGTFGGYCATGGCDDEEIDFNCEGGSSCVDYLGYPVCLKNCSSVGDCRASDGQSCELSGENKVCMP